MSTATVSVDLAHLDNVGDTGIIYFRLYQVVTLSDNTTLYPSTYSAAVTAGLASVTLSATSDAIKGQNAPYVVEYQPASGPRVTLGRIVVTPGGPHNLSDLLEVGGTSTQIAHTIVAASNITFVASIAALQALTGMNNLDRAFVLDVGIYRYNPSAADTAVGSLIITPSGGTGRWFLEEDGASWRNVFNVKQYGALGDGTTDDYTAIAAAITAAAAAKALGQNPILYFPPAVSYATASPVVVATGVSVLMDAPLVYTGSSNVTALSIGTAGTANNSRLRFRINVQRSTQSTWADAVEVWRPATTYSVGDIRRNGYLNYTVASITTGISASSGGPTGTAAGITDGGVTWDYTSATQETNIGVKFINPTACIFENVSAAGFTIGAQFIGNTAGCAYNTVTLGNLQSNKIGVDVTCVTAGGFANENVFTGGRFWVATGVNTTRSRYGIRIATQDGAYTSNNGNVFIKPSLELNHSNCTGSAQGIGAVFEIGQRNHIVDARAEDDYAAVEWRGSCDGNRMDIAYSSLTVNQLDYSTSANNIATLMSMCVADTMGRLIFSSGPMGSTWSPYTGSATFIKGCSIISNASPTMNRSASSLAPGGTAWAITTAYSVGDVRSNDGGKLYQVITAGTSAGAGGPTGTAISGIVDGSVVWGYVGPADVMQITSSRGVGVYIDTTNAKNFLVSREAVVSRGGRVALVCYDGTGAVLSGSSPSYAKGTLAATISASTSVGGNGYRTGSDSGNAVVVTVRDEVKAIWIGIAGGSNPAIIRNFSIYVLDTVATVPAVSAGYSGKTISDRLVATVVPASGTWEAGAVVFNDTPAVGTPGGWVCVTAGTPGTWAAFGRVDLDGSATWDPGNLVDGAGETSAGITATGAALGDFVVCSAPYDLQGITCNAYVSAADTVKIRLQNETGGAIDLASGTWRVRVIKA